MRGLTRRESSARRAALAVVAGLMLLAHSGGLGCGGGCTSSRPPPAPVATGSWDAESWREQRDAERREQASQKNRDEFERTVIRFAFMGLLAFLTVWWRSRRTDEAEPDPEPPRQPQPPEAPEPSQPLRQPPHPVAEPPRAAPLLTGATAPVPRPLRPAPTRRPSSRGRWLGVLAGLLVACGLVFLLFEADALIGESRRVAPAPDTALAGFVRIAPGSFLMGSPSDESERHDDETQHNVTLTRPFWLGVHEVTHAEWEAMSGDSPARFSACGGTCPVENVTWEDAVAHADARSRAEGLEPCYEGGRFMGLACTGYRLPTEAEWEYAARAGASRATRRLVDDVGWYGGNSADRTHPVGQKAPNAWGLHDMLGNVREWTGDWYGAYGGAVTDPEGPSSGVHRVFRGGGWDSHPRCLRAAFRHRSKPSYSDYGLGFRLARSILAP
jgi:formylglycine-generating enzyme required for sulfatase activity